MAEPIRVVAKAPGLQMEVKIHGTTFYVRPATGALVDEALRDLLKRYPNGDFPQEERVRAVKRAVLVGFDGLALARAGEAPEVVDSSKGCPTCRGSGNLPSGKCAGCDGSGDFRDFLLRCLPPLTTDRLLREASSQFQAEVALLKN